MACTGNYYINLDEGTIQQQCNGLLVDALRATGFVGPYPTIAAAKASVEPLSTAVKTGAGAVEGAATAVPDFLSRLTSANLWERIGEVVLGIVLIAVGLARITHAVPVATQIAKTAGAVAVA